VRIDSEANNGAVWIPQQVDPKNDEVVGPYVGLVYALESVNDPPFESIEKVYDFAHSNIKLLNKQYRVDGMHQIRKRMEELMEAKII
jgi:hypothetical protein